MKDIYLMKEGKRYGPLSEDEVGEALVGACIPFYEPAWHSGTQYWVRIGRLIAVQEGLGCSPLDEEEIGRTPSYSI